MARLTKAQQADKAEAIAYLRKHVNVGDRVYCILRSVSRSGMNRKMDLYLMRDNQPMRITRSVATATENTYDERSETLSIGGCGMDMGFAVVSHLAGVLFPDGFDCTGRSEHPDMCPSAEHSNDSHDERWRFMMEHDGLSWPDTEPYRYSVERRHKSGEYALKHEWMR